MDTDVGGTAVIHTRTLNTSAVLLILVTWAVVDVITAHEDGEAVAIAWTLEVGFGTGLGGGDLCEGEHVV